LLAEGNCSPHRSKPEVYFFASSLLLHAAKMPRTILNLVLRLVISLVIFVAVMFFVAWLLEDVIFFSLFIGIPAGRYQCDSHVRAAHCAARQEEEMSTNAASTKRKRINRLLWPLKGKKHDLPLSGERIPYSVGSFEKIYIVI